LARSLLTDYLQVYPFWLFDVFPIEPTGLPVLNPILGFSTVTSPEFNLETVSFYEGNYAPQRKIVHHYNVSPVTLTRAVAFYDSDYYRWIVATYTGNTAASSIIAATPSLQIAGPSYRRNLVLVHFFSRNVLLAAAQQVTTASLQLGSTVASAAQASQASQYLQQAANAASSLGVGPFEIVPRVPAKAFLLEGCVPSRYKSGGDFDASSSAISVAELTLEVESVTEIALTA
jgi:hypothetical protein